MILIRRLRAFPLNTIKCQRHTFELQPPLARWFHSGPSALYTADDYVGTSFESNLHHYIPACQGITPKTHTMGDSLHRYLAMKIHPLVDCSEWTNLVVVGQHSRVHDAGTVVSSKEKRDKPFNWMRPTAKHLGLIFIYSVFRVRIISSIMLLFWQLICVLPEEVRQR